jgi:hypothetical protein
MANTNSAALFDIFERLSVMTPSQVALVVFLAVGMALTKIGIFVFQVWCAWTLFQIFDHMDKKWGGK